MERRRLGNSDMDVSVISLGAWSYGKVPRWGLDVDEDVIETLHKAIDYGINLIDTAPSYGESEEVIGRAVKGIREKVYIATKCSAHPTSILQEIDYSLKRLQVDYIDLYQVHYPDVEVPIASTIGAMEKIKRQGKIRYIGVSNFSIEQLEEGMKVTEITSCQSPYNLLWRETEETGLLEFCRKNKIGLLTYSSLAQGLLTGKFKSRADLPSTEGETRTVNLLFKPGVFEECLKVVEVVREIGRKYDKTPAEVSLNWLINQDRVTSAITGVRNICQIEDNIRAIGWRLSEEDVNILRCKGKEASRLLDYTNNMWGHRYPR